MIQHQKAGARTLRVLFVEEYLPQEMLGIMWLSRAVKDAGHQSRALLLPDRDWIRKLREYDPDVVLFSVTTGMHVYLSEVNQRIKRELPGVLSVFGGPHATFSPEYLETPGIDAICRGEGEAALVELLDRMSRGEPYHDVRNFHFKIPETGEIVKNEQRPLERELDRLGFPDREVLYEAGAIYRNSDRKVFVSQRGCPMPCSFCFHHAMKKKVYGVGNKDYVRKRSVTHLLDEIQQVRQRYNLKFVHFVDDIFNLSSEWLTEFCERYPKEIGLPFDVILMANMTREHHVEQLARAGCVYARIAFEAANDHIRNDIFKKHTTRQQLMDAAGWIRKHGIRLGSLNILGGPGGTLQDEFDTLRLNIEAKVDHPMVSLMQPYPMFDIEETTKAMGYAVSALDEFPVNFRRTAPMLSDHKHQIENLHKLFPLTVRNPWLMRFVPALVKPKWMYRPLLVVFMLHAEYLVAEQAMIYAKAQGLGGPRYWTWVDFALRSVTKGTMRLYQTLFARFSTRLSEAGAELKVKLQMGDERVVAHMD